jgi:predicted porin
MVKALFGTSALAIVAMVAMGSAPAYGETLTSGAVPPSLKIDGYTAINAYFVNQQRRENGKGGPQPHLDNGVSNLYFTIAGTSAQGIGYMYRVTFETLSGTENIIDQNYVEIKAKFGTFQFGNNVGPEDTMIWDAGKIIGGTGAFDGAYSNVYNMSSGVIRGNDNIGDTGNATKIVYYSPEMMGWQVGVAYTPDTKHKGDAKLNTMNGSGDRLPGNRGLWDFKRAQPYDLRSFAIGLTYKKEIGQWSVTLSGAGITAKSYFFSSQSPVVTGGRVPLQNTKAYQLGAVLGYGDWRFGLGFLDNGKSRLPKSPGFTFNNTATSNVSMGSMNSGNAGKAWNVGAGYTMGAYQLAASYQRTNRSTGDYQKAHSDFYSATVDVTPVQGLKVYTEVDYIRSRTNSTQMAREQSMASLASAPTFSAIGNNSGLLGIVGTKVSF